MTAWEKRKLPVRLIPEHLVPRLQRQLLEGGSRGKRGVVDEYVRPVSLLGYEGDRCVNVLLQGNVASDRESPPALCLDLTH